MKKQFVTYEIALKLKELGFDEPCLAYYDIKILFPIEQPLPDEFNTTKTNNIYYDNDFHYPLIKLEDDIIIAPLWQQVWSFLDDNGVIIGIIFVDNVFKYTLNIENYVSNEFKDRMSVIKSATEYATNYLWNKKFNK